MRKLNRLTKLFSTHPAAGSDNDPQRCQRLENLIGDLWVDILALKQHRQQHARERDLLRTLIDTIPDYIFIKDRSSRFILNNAAHLRQLKVRDQSEAIGKTDFEFFPPQIAQHYYADEQRIFRDGVGVIDREEKGVLPDGSEIWLSTTKVAVRDSEGKIVGLVGISRDITHRKRAEEERARLEEQLRQASKLESLGRLAGGVAHDFNNMLCAIRGYTQLLDKELTDLPPPLKHHLKSIEKAATSAGELTRNLLAFGRKSSCQLVFCDIHESIQTVTNLLQRTIDRTITIRHELLASPSTIMADCALIENALLNIAVNSRDAMPGGGEISILTSNIDIKPQSELCRRLQLAPATYLRLTITDTGVGMAPATLAQVFEPFFTTKDQGKGTGLGLASVYGTVKAHGGGIEVASKPGCGTTVQIYLPIARVSQPVPEQAPDNSIPQRSGTILVADDEELVRTMVSTLLQLQGFQTIVCCDGLEAVESYRRHREKIDLSIIDMIMPGLGGPDCMLSIRKLNPAARFIVMSGYSRPDETSRIPVSGVKAFIQKPFDADALTRMVLRALP